MSSAAVRALPLVRAWQEPENPLPVRSIVAPRHRPRGFGPRADIPTGPSDRPFDFCFHLRRLAEDVCRRTPELNHLDLERVLIAVTQARNGHRHGLQARVTPLRFRAGSLTRRRRGVTFQVQRYVVDRRECLYLMTFCLPRFLDLDFDEKLITLFHELYHISPQFDGDLRRHAGRYSIHSHSQRRYDDQMAHLARGYLRSGADAALHAWLRLDFASLQERHGSVVGAKVPRPKVIPVAAARSD